MSGPKVIHYTVEQLAAMAEARDRELQAARLRALQGDAPELLAETRAAEATYGERIGLVLTAVGDGGDSAALRRAADRLERELQAGRQALDTLRTRARNARLLARLQQTAPAPRTTAPSAATAERAPIRPAVPEPVIEQVRQALDELDPRLDADPALLELADAIRRAAADDGGMAVRAFRAAIAERNRAHRRSTERAAALRDLAVRADALGAEADAFRRRVRAAQPSIASGDDGRLAALIEDVEAAEQAARRRDEARYVADSMAEILAQLGYEAVEGFDTLVPSDGGLVRKPGWRQHALLVDVEDGEIDVQVVRTATDARKDLSRTRDTEVEVDFCSDLPAMLLGLQQRDVAAGDIRARKPGVAAALVLPGATPWEQQLQRAARRDDRTRAR